MKKIFFWGIIVLFLGTTNSCKKNRTSTTYVNGIVSEKGTGNLVSSAIIILGRKKKNSFSGAMLETVKSTLSNSNGEYSIEYEEDEDYTYSIIVRKIPYYESTYYYPDSGKKNLFNISLSAPSYLKLKIKNISGADRLAIGYPCSSECDFYGTVIDTTTQPITINSNEYLRLYWLTYKYGVDTTKDSVNILIPSFDTIIYNLNY